MTDDVVKTAADAVATMAQAAPPSGGKIERPTPTSERTIVGIVAAAFVCTVGIVMLLVFANPPDKVIIYVGVTLWVLAGTPFLIALSFASPWLGSERISAGPAGVSIELNGQKDRAGEPGSRP